jgi:hypothetical protein
MRLPPQVYQLFKAVGVQPTTKLYNCVIRAYERGGQWKKVRPTPRSLCTTDPREASLL